MTERKKDYRIQYIRQRLLTPRRPSPAREARERRRARGANTVKHYDGRLVSLRLLYGPGKKDEFVFNHPPKNKS